MVVLRGMARGFADWLCHSSLVVALGAGSLTLAAFVAFGSAGITFHRLGAEHWFYVAFVVLITFAVYTSDRLWLARSPQDHANRRSGVRWQYKRRRILPLLAGLALLFSLLSLVLCVITAADGRVNLSGKKEAGVNSAVWLSLGAGMLLGWAYSFALPKPIGRRLQDFGFLKPFVASAVWVCGTLLVPYVWLGTARGQVLSSPSPALFAGLYLVGSGSLLVLNAHYCDVLDTRGDRQLGRRTLAVRIGPWRALRWLALLGAALALALAFSAVTLLLCYPRPLLPGATDAAWCSESVGMSLLAAVVASLCLYCLLCVAYGALRRARVQAPTLRAMCDGLLLVPGLWALVLVFS